MSTYDEQELRKLAYSLWEEAGKPEGREQDFWKQAETKLYVVEEDVNNQDIDETSKQSFPASDSPNNT